MKQQQRTNRKRGRGRRVRGGGGVSAAAQSTSTTNDESIEEQLRRQRLKKQQQREEDNNKDHKQIDDTAKHPALRLGSYVYDPERQAYFEESFLVQQQKQRRKKDHPEEFWEYHENKRNSVPPSTTCMSYKREICASERKRHDLTSQWRGRHFLAHLRNEPIPEVEGNARWWSSPKETPWSRTFDVVASDCCYTPPSIERLGRRIEHWWYGSPAPALLRRTEGVTHIKVLDQEMVELCQSESECSVVVHYQPLPKASDYLYYYKVDLPPLINDCTSLKHYGSGPGAVLFAGGRRLLLWSDRDLGGNSGRFHCSPQIPTSDILTVENLDHASSLLLGHRNGQVSLQDLRSTSAASCSQLPSNKNDANGFGSVVALHPLNKHRPYQVLARSGGVNDGHCRLFDVRMFASSSTSATTNRSSVVHELRIPNQQHGKKHISKGVATDPSQTVAIAPFVDDTTNTAQIGVWSLDSGVFVGSKPVGGTIATATINNNSAAIDCLELCPKITRRWTMESSDDSDYDSPVPVAGSFSLWLNCGLQGIRQISCDGRWD